MLCMQLSGWLMMLTAALGQSDMATSRPTRESLDDLLDEIRRQNHLPALGGAIVDGGKVVAIGVAGFRQVGEKAKVTVHDKWHIGSCTKAMTATLCGMLVEEGKLKWTSTLGEVFPDLRDSMHADYREVTLEQLLGHRGGVPSDLDEGGLWKKLWKREGTPTEQRRMLMEGVLRRPPVSKPGTEYLYSNAGVAMAGAMAEKVTGTPYEKLLTERLFKPLGMKSAGFGAPGSAKKIDQPRGHARIEEADQPVKPGKFADNPPSIAPAGTVHCSLEDWAAFVALHLTEKRGKSPLIKPATLKKLHTPLEGQEYSLGWIVTQRPWGGGEVLTHAGSNNSWYAVVWAAPTRNFAVLIVTNQGGPEAAKACDETAGALIEHREKMRKRR